MVLFGGVQIVAGSSSVRSWITRRFKRRHGRFHEAFVPAKILIRLEAGKPALPAGLELKQL